MIDATPGGTALRGGLLAGTTTPSSTLGKNEFLTLLVTQLKNQDPLSPLQAHEFAAQLAQFSSVEQLTQLNASVDQQSQALGLVTLMSKTAFSASLIGRQISAVGDRVVVPAGGGGTVRVEVGGGGGRGTLRVLDTNGRLVASKDLGRLAPGRQDITLPADVPPGTYRYEVKVEDADGGAVPVTTFTTGVVDAVHFDDRGIVLRIGSIEIALDALSEIQPSR
jgi:flagellar basal-body rod modification protein FlgD